MSNIEERKRKLKELLAYAKKTSWRRKSLEKRIGEIVIYLSQTVFWFKVFYAERVKAIIFEALATPITEERKVTILWYVTSTSINREIVFFIEGLLDDIEYYENTER